MRAMRLHVTARSPGRGAKLSLGRIKSCPRVLRPLHAREAWESVDFSSGGANALCCEKREKTMAI